jgi:hypothetical protein
LKAEICSDIYRQERLLINKIVFDGGTSYSDPNKLLSSPLLSSPLLSSPLCCNSYTKLNIL